MAKSVLSAPHFHNEDAAFAYVEAQLWPNGPVCPHCGNVDNGRIGRLTGKSTRPGLRKCYACRKTFTVRIGSIFEDSHLPLRLWLQVIHLICASKKGIATRQIQRMLQLQHENRLVPWPSYPRHDGPGGRPGPLGGAGKTVEADDMEMGRRPRPASVPAVARRTSRC